MIVTAKNKIPLLWQFAIAAPSGALRFKYMIMGAVFVFSIKTKQEMGINVAAGAIIGYFGTCQDQLEWLREHPEAIITATEEFVRIVTPLTHIGRVCPTKTEVHGHTIQADERISLCWASANMDETVFENPQEVRLDRKPNPHVGFGSGAHSCLGAHHARLIIRSLLKGLIQSVGSIEILDATEHIERESHYNRKVGFERLLVRFLPIKHPES